MAFANYLSGKGHKIQIIDCDSQRSIYNKRKLEIQNAGDANLKVPYKVMGYTFKDRDKVKSLLTMLSDDDTISLIDLLGKSAENGMQDILFNSDVIVVPFKYEFMVLGTTAEFLLNLITDIKKNGKERHCKLAMVPNFFNSSAGTKEEREKFKTITDTFRKFGIVTDPIKQRQDMQRFSTLSELDLQNEIVENSFSQIYDLIFTNNSNN